MSGVDARVDNGHQPEMLCASCAGVTREKFGNFSNKSSPSRDDFELEALRSSARFDIELLMGEMLPFGEDRISSLHLRLSWSRASHPDLQIRSCENLIKRYPDLLSPTSLLRQPPSFPWP